MPLYLGSSDPSGSSNPIVRFALALLAGAIFVLTAMVGAVVFLAALGIAFVGSILIMARVWWLQRKMRRSMASGDSRTPPPSSGAVLEGEYTVVSSQRRRDE